MEIVLGKTRVSDHDAPWSGTVIDGNIHWEIVQKFNGLISLELNMANGSRRVHPEFVEPMNMLDFILWINS
jgi:hypothetical protein